MYQCWFYLSALDTRVSEMFNFNLSINHSYGLSCYEHKNDIKIDKYLVYVFSHLQIYLFTQGRVYVEIAYTNVKLINIKFIFVDLIPYMKYAWAIQAGRRRARWLFFSRMYFTQYIFTYNLICECVTPYTCIINGQSWNQKKIYISLMYTTSYNINFMLRRTFFKECISHNNYEAIWLKVLQKGGTI